MENNKSTFFNSALNHGLIFGLILIIFQLALWMLNIMPIGIGRGLLMFVVNIIIYIVAIFLFTKSYREGSLGGFITYGQGFKYGLAVVVVSTVVYIVYTYVFNSFIDPAYQSEVLKASLNWTEEFMRSKGMSEGQIADAMAKAYEKGLPSTFKTIWTGLLGGVILGAIISLITAAMAKKLDNPVREG